MHAGEGELLVVVCKCACMRVCDQAHSVLLRRRVEQKGGDASGKTCSVLRWDILGDAGLGHLQMPWSWGRCFYWLCLVQAGLFLASRRRQTETWDLFLKRRPFVRMHVRSACV